MVTRIVVLRITPPAERASAAEDDSNGYDNNVNQLQNKEGDNDFDGGKYVTKNHDMDIQFCSNSKRSCLSKAADGGFFDGHSQNDVSSHYKPNVYTIDERTAVDIRRHNATSTKRPLLLEDDAEDNGKKKRGKKRQQKFIDLADIPPQPQSPICKSNGSKDGASKYQGVTFNKAANKWQAQLSIGGKHHLIGVYDNEEEAAIDHARAVFTYKTEIIQRGRPSAKQTEVQRELCSYIGCTNQTQYGGLCRHHKQKPQKQKGGCTNHVSVNDISSFSMDLVNKGGRIGIYLPDERKARIARFHAKRSTRVFKRRVTYDARKTFADSRPRIKGRFVVQKSVVGGEDST